MKKLFLVLSVICLGSIGCSSEVETCETGETRACACPGTSEGTQECVLGVNRWDVCQCPGTVDGSVPYPPCAPRGAVILSCGCRGSVDEGEQIIATGCCSGEAVVKACYAADECTAGVLPWGARCL